MTTIANIFAHKKTFIGYITAGDGGVDYCVDCCLALIAGGVDILELGFPFSDPIGDGPVIQEASQRALKAGTTPETVLEIARRVRQKSNTPLVLMSYYNPLLQAGQKYLGHLKDAGFEAVLVVDLPAPQEGTPHPFLQSLKEAQLQSILLATATTDERRLRQIACHAEGFLYYVCQRGTTGIRKGLPSDFDSQISRLRQLVDLPIVAGFGIGDRTSATKAIEQADGCVVGSAFVKRMGDRISPSELTVVAAAIKPLL